MNTDERMVPVTITVMVDPQPDEDGHHVLRWPSGHAMRFPSDAIEGLYGFAVPEPPRVGPVGLSEEETRTWARGACGGEHCTSDSAVHRGWDKFIRACRDAVAEWDAEGERTERRERLERERRIAAWRREAGR